MDPIELIKKDLNEDELLPPELKRMVLERVKSRLKDKEEIKQELWSLYL